MAAVLDQLDKSTLSLLGNKLGGIWGYIDRDKPNDLMPSLSKLHYSYSVDGVPSGIYLRDYNRGVIRTIGVPPPSNLDELDQNAPKLIPTGVVSQAYKSSTGNNYKDLGPAGGRY
jgi:hypothetical protein